MQRLAPHTDQYGYVTIAQNNSTTDYLELAYLQALSIKAAMPDGKYAVIVDKNTMLAVTKKHKKIFDYVIEMPVDTAANNEWKLSNEWQAFTLTPFKETVKLESDILITRDISHWKYLYRMRDIVLPVGCKDFRGHTATSRAYRKIFDINNLPDVYSGMMYFRYSKTATQFFTVAKAIFKNWNTVKQELKLATQEEATTDLVYALAARIIGEEKTTIPLADMLQFIHMKNKINNWSNASYWSDLANVELDGIIVRINNINQLSPVHYQDKTWPTGELIQHYEQYVN